MPGPPAALATAAGSALPRQEKMGSKVGWFVGLDSKDSCDMDLAAVTRSGRSP